MTPWKKAAARAAVYALAGVAAMSWGLAMLGGPMPLVAGIGGFVIAGCLAPTWVPACRRHWQQRWQQDEAERRRRWEKRLNEWGDNPPP